MLIWSSMTTLTTKMPHVRQTAQAIIAYCVWHGDSSTLREFIKSTPIDTALSLIYKQKFSVSGIAMIHRSVNFPQTEDTPPPFNMILLSFLRVLIDCSLGMPYVVIKLGSGNGLVLWCLKLYLIFPRCQRTKFNIYIYIYIFWCWNQNILG